MGAGQSTEYNDASPGQSCDSELPSKRGTNNIHVGLSSNHLICVLWIISDYK